MAILVNVFQIRKSFAARPLFDGITFAVESGERVGLIGPNGAGKSTLLKILASRMTPDEGQVSFQKGLRVGLLEQTPQFKPGASVFDTILEGCAEMGGDVHDWENQSKAHEILSKLDIDDPSQPIERMSGGWKKRVALGREWMKSPDLLLLDEPTNHLDVESILWMESWIASAPFAVLMITHDRLFLQNTTNRILELDRRNPGGLLSISGDYSNYLEVKDQMMAAQERREVVLKNTLRRETEWLRQGAKARTTKQQARIQRAKSLETEVQELGVRNQSRTAQFDFQSAEKNPKKLIEAIGVSKRLGNRTLFKDFSLMLTPGRRVGILGKNGCGKSTLIRILLGMETPDSGSIKHAEQLSIAYFEQNREALDPTISVAKTICPSGEFVDFQGNRIHIRSYLDRFLFSQGQMDMAVGKLSGGEQSRLMIAQLMLTQANLLVLDEPTNDLDIATLNVLEECLTEFKGAVLLVTHDRYFLAQVANQILAFSIDSDQITSFASFDQWDKWHGTQPKEQLKTKKGSESSALSQSNATSSRKQKLSYKDQRELDGMEARIQQVEADLAELTLQSEDPKNLTNAVKLLEVTQKMNEAQKEIDRLYARWAELEQS